MENHQQENYVCQQRMESVRSLYNELLNYKNLITDIKERNKAKINYLDSQNRFLKQQLKIEENKGKQVQALLEKTSKQEKRRLSRKINSSKRKTFKFNRSLSLKQENKIVQKNKSLIELPFNDKQKKPVSPLDSLDQ